MAIEIVVPELGESITEATIVRWLKQQGENVSVGDVLLELETDKVNLEVGAESAGVLARIDRDAGSDVKVGEVIGVIEGNGAAAAAPAKEKPPEAPKPEPKPAEAGVGMKATAAAPAEASDEEDEAEGDVEEDRTEAPLKRRKGSQMRAEAQREQPSSEVRREEMRPLITDKTVSTPKAERPAPVPPQPAMSRAGDDREERVRMTRRRRTIAERLLAVRQSTAMLTTFNEFDMSAVMRIRKRHKELFQERYGVSLGLTSFFVKATVAALREFPNLNAELDGEEIIYKYYYDIGTALDTPEGLVVPVIRDADRLTFAEIEKRVKGLIEKAREGKLGIDDLRGGTFTITNGGIFGSLMSTPILNPPQVAILGLHRIQDRPVAIDGQVAVRPMMYAALSYDHRLIDGRDAVKFLVRVKELIEDPERLLVDI